MEQTFQYKAPVFFGDTIHFNMRVKSTKPSSKGGKGVVVFDTEIINQDGVIVTSGVWTVLFRDK